MEDTFVLKIQLGDDAMQTPSDVADALRATAEAIEMSGLERRYGRVVDINGNSVGEWELQ